MSLYSDVTCITIDSSPKTQFRESRRWVGDARGDYYGESAGSYMVKEFK